MSRKPITSTSMLDNEQSRPYIRENASFATFLQQKKVETERQASDLRAEIDRLEADIQARVQHLSELEEIVARCDAALTIDVKPRTTSPRLAEALTHAVEEEVNA